MCLLVNTYQTCALFGHPIQTGSAAACEYALCDEAKASGTFGMCQGGATTRNVPDFVSPFCIECNGLEARAQEKVKTMLQSSEAEDAASRDEKTTATTTSASWRKTTHAPILSDDFIRELGGRPVSPDRAPAVSRDEMLASMYALAVMPPSKVDRVRAEVWVAAERRRDKRRSPNSALASRDGLREMFARWLVHACRAVHVEAALAVALDEEDMARVSLLQLVAAQTTVTSTYQARLECVGVFEEFLSYAGLDGVVGSDSALVLAESRILDEDVKLECR
jgi:hypothetical protein